MGEGDGSVGPTDDGPTRLVNQGVMPTAEKDQVGEVGLPFRKPRIDVVGVTPLWRAATAWEATVLVPYGQRPTLRRRGEANLAAHVEHNGVAGHIEVRWVSRRLDAVGVAGGQVGECVCPPL